MKSQAAEAALPAFDLGKKVGQKIALQKFRTPIVLCVVDIADFDGSLPRQALLSFLPKYAQPQSVCSSSSTEWEWLLPCFMTGFKGDVGRPRLQRKVSVRD